MSEVYPLGAFHRVMPIPPLDAHCVSVDAGPVRLVVESRQLTEELARTASSDVARVVDAMPDADFDDYGASLHVFGTADALEHLRFDCFAKEPHYHYVRNAEGGQVVCRFDEHAEGDPIAWTIARLEQRLPEMLEFAGVPDLAAEANREYPAIRSAVREVARLLELADRDAAKGRPVRAEVGR